MPSIKRFRFFWCQGRHEKQVHYHASLITDPAKTLCGSKTEAMATDGYEYQLPPPKVNCFKCLKEMKHYWPEKGSYFMDGLR